LTQPLFCVDAFTAEPFAGNPAAACLLDPGAESLPGGAQGPDRAWMQRAAAEMNLSETAFLRPGPEPGAYGLRWFTPTVEVELCGHATLASAHVLWSEGRVGPDEPIRFATASGPLAARPGPAPRAPSGSTSRPPRPSPWAHPRGWSRPLGAERRAGLAEDTSTTWSSWRTRRPCATLPPTSGGWGA
jgi:predicted PhzF superfamily epimerase YddE/YHI9